MSRRNSTPAKAIASVSGFWFVLRRTSQSDNPTRYVRTTQTPLIRRTQSRLARDRIRELARSFLADFVLGRRYATRHGTRHDGGYFGRSTQSTTSRQCLRSTNQRSDPLNRRDYRRLCKLSHRATRISELCIAESCRGDGCKGCCTMATQVGFSVASPRQPQSAP